MSEPQTHGSHKQTIAELQRQIRKRDQVSPCDATEIRSTGCAELDDLFPSQGVRGGTLVEWLGDGVASGAATLSLLIGQQVCRPGRPVVVIDTRRDLFPPSLEILGFDLSRLVMIHPASDRNALWACEEALHCEGVGLVWANIEQLSSTSFRRLQLAAEVCHGIGFLLRSARAMQQPSWADARLLVRPFPSHEASPRFQVNVAYSHGRPRRATASIMLGSFRGNRSQPGDWLIFPASTSVGSTERKA